MYTMYIIHDLVGQSTSKYFYETCYGYCYIVVIYDLEKTVSILNK